MEKRGSEPRLITRHVDFRTATTGFTEKTDKVATYGLAASWRRHEPKRFFQGALARLSTSEIRADRILRPSRSCGKF